MLGSFTDVYKSGTQKLRQVKRIIIHYVYNMKYPPEMFAVLMWERL